MPGFDSQAEASPQIWRKMEATSNIIVPTWLAAVILVSEALALSALLAAWMYRDGRRERKPKGGRYGS